MTNTFTANCVLGLTLVPTHVKIHTGHVWWRKQELTQQRGAWESFHCTLLLCNNSS